MSKRINAWWPRKPSPGNFGDILTPIILQKVFGYDEVTFSNKPFDKPTILGAGSIIAHTGPNAIVWGSGLMSSKGNFSEEAEYLAVRGPRTRDIISNSGILVGNGMGDPALLMPTVYPNNTKPLYDYGFFAHYVDTVQVRSWYKSSTNSTIINPLNSNPFEVIDHVLKCKKIISSSLHGLIIANAYGIPAAWVKHSDRLNGDDIKFYDYYESLEIYHSSSLDFQERIKPEDFDKLNYILPLPENINKLQESLKKAWIQKFDE